MSKAAELANLIGNINAGGGGVNRNLIINGAMNVAQRGTSSTGIGASTGYFTCDRWFFNVGSTAGRLTMTQDSSAPSGFANSMKLECTTADTSIAAGEAALIMQRIEGQNLQAFAKGTSDAKPFAVSFYVKGNASATYACELFDRDNTRQASKLFNVTTDWTRVELTFDKDTTGAFDDDNGTSLDLAIFLHAGSTFTSGTLNQTFASSTNANRAVGISSFFDSTDRTFFITGVQLEVGQNATEFEHEPFERTLQKCQRYYHRLDTSSNDFLGFSSGGAFGGNTALTEFKPIVPMRNEPTFSTNAYSNANFVIVTGSSTSQISSAIAVTGSNDAIRLNATSASSMTVGNYAYLQLNDTAYVEFIAEL